MDEPDPKFSTQTKARKAALDILFQADLRREDILHVLWDQQAADERPLRPLTLEIVRGVAEHLEKIDARLRTISDGQWSLERMPRVDRSLARLGVFEMDYTDTPDHVVISEVVELASWLSTDESPSFLNGLLARATGDSTAP